VSKKCKGDQIGLLETAFNCLFRAYAAGRFLALTTCILFLPIYISKQEVMRDEGAEA
jgi:hypothetical protein